MKTYEQFLADIYKYKLVCDMDNLKISFQYANGCGAKGGVQFPSTMWGINIESACNIHDIDWKLAKSHQELLDANERFDNNLKKITDHESMNDFTRWARRLRVAKYVSGVELYGTQTYATERGFI